ncbi:short-chain dehydrogenase/reductase-like protein [Mollisia scopiformis]|uniref:Short-chain dehydrogenase/reductase-like protein n=1 Tax=Mollisia scopiformis TaxID=149040 RepID=A0A132B418_MOLSC|nr:short-chain dehydrogenase/reductase-like protein [Mollisia scopiformis]KUJ06664.1 short-chain dehydrogenase/reductase-like protein [Mollisia scopiformis]
MLNPFSYFHLPADFVGSFLVSQFTKLPYPDADFKGQTIIVTGANVGLGLEAARHFVRLGASKVILGCRNKEKGDGAKRIIEVTTGRMNVVGVWQVDLSSYESVRQFCERASKLERLDAVVENAGVATPTYEECENMESTITVNVISTFLMALLLLPKLRADAVKYNITPHLTIVASDAHEQASFREQSAPRIFSALRSPKYQSDKYNVSKLLEILTIRELAPAMSSSGKPKIILNTLTPGFCHSELMRHASFPLNLLGWIGKILIGRTTEMGSRTLVAAACAGDETHGTYMTDCKVRDPSKWVQSEKGKDAQQRVYKELLGILEEIEPGVTKNI